MDDQRRERLMPEHEKWLDLVVRAHYNTSVACRQYNKTVFRPIKPGSFNVRLGRLAKHLGCNSVLDMLVWYELEYKGPERARKWQGLFEGRWWSQATAHCPRAVKFLEESVTLTQQHVRNRSGVIAERNHVERTTVYRHLGGFASAAGMPYSFDWLTFLYALYKELQVRPELTQESSGVR